MGSIEEEIADSWLFKAYAFSDDWEIPLIRNALKSLVSRKARALVHKTDLSFLREMQENGHHTDAVLQQRDVEASTRLEKVNEDLMRLEEKRKVLEGKRTREASKGNLF